MEQRLPFIDLPSRPKTGSGDQLEHEKSTPSPGMLHIAGAIPPTLSPLDVFAAQSRLLAKKLDESRQNGRRVSRLPPLAVADTLARSKPSYYRTASQDNAQSLSMESAIYDHEERLATRTEVESPAFRPKSHYTRMSRVTGPADEQLPVLHPAHGPSHSNSQQWPSPMPQGDYFGAPRTESPELSAPPRKSMDSISQSSSVDRYRGPNESPRIFDQQRGASMESSSPHSQYSNMLLPPNPPYARKAPSIQSTSSEDDNTAYTPASSMSQRRKLSSGSAVSLPQSPFSPYLLQHGRTSSQHSDFSLSGNRLSRPAFNFSRPLSRSSRPSMEFSRPSPGPPSRQHSTESERQTAHEYSAQTPASVDDEEYFIAHEQQPPSASYIYAKFSLPRGRLVPRESVSFGSLVAPSQFERERRELGPSQIPFPKAQLPSSLPGSTHSLAKEWQDDVERPRESSESMPARPFLPAAAAESPSRHSLTSMNSGSTIKAPRQSAAPLPELSAEEHLQKGIECHEKGSLNESTYHLRIAARQNNPTAMLLYALACRHGWGMRQNPQEGVRWLRKAMDCAGIELEADEDPSNQRNPADAEARKTRRAQFALSVYELGVSHMNGWGIEQDKALALRCFEIASSWGDADAMAEAGFCYAQAVGCKKDLKKAALYYRQAEAKGMSMVGNSWIYKPKYADDSDDRVARSARPGAAAEKKPRDKIRTRTLFGRKKTSAAE